VRYLVDTNIFLFLVQEPDRISKEVYEILMDTENLIYISSESVKEIIHLLHSGRIVRSAWKTAKDIIASITEANLQVDWFKAEHAQTLSMLVPNENHNDPVDHAIMAHAITNKLTLISSDHKMKYYGDQGLDFIWNHVK
jgi:PIN domain nuclease of toxin-antitoxin system